MPGTQDRLRLLFDSDQPRFIGSGQPHQISNSAWLFPEHPSSSSSSSSTSTARPAARRSSKSSASAGSTASTAPSTILSRSSSHNDADSASSRSSAPANPVPWVPTHLVMGTYAPGYDLPCEFSFLGCNVRFTPESYQEWIDHSASHFAGHSPPARLVCTFCDTEFDSSRINGNRMANYERRMVHIGQHFWDRRTLDVDAEPDSHARPDYHLIDYMRRKNLLDEGDYKYLTQHSERPPCDNIRPLGFVPTEVQAKRAREDRRPHDQAREDRQRKKERDGKGRSTHHRKAIR